MPSNEPCACGDRATTACNHCEASLCDNCSAPNFRCYTCAGSHASASSLFDDPETISLEDDDDDEDRSGESDSGWDDDSYDLGEEL